MSTQTTLSNDSLTAFAVKTESGFGLDLVLQRDGKRERVQLALPALKGAFGKTPVVATLSDAAIEVTIGKTTHVLKQRVAADTGREYYFAWLKPLPPLGAPASLADLLAARKQ